MLRPRHISANHRDVFLSRYKGLHAWALQMTAHDEALAEDLLHDLFILFTLNQPELERIQNLDSYLYTCLRNLHTSQLRRATRARFEQLSIVEYDSAKLSLQAVSYGRDWIQAQDDLRRVCHYANARKDSANAASVLILRFFHGYYPSEIAKVVRITRAAVSKRLLAARAEAKAYLQNSSALSFLGGENQSAPPEVIPANFARRTGDFLQELQQTIFQSRPGDCLPSGELKRIYGSDHKTSISRRSVAHIVSCPVCLDTVNKLLGLPLLTERYPTDTMDKDNKKGGGPPEGGDPGERVRKLKDWEREASDAFEHRPQELCVAVNGYMVGSQLIGSELSDLTLNVTADERISFCEVFSEQGVRLMMMNVDELPPSGPGELRQHLQLSDARTLESELLFSNPFPTLHITYRDPALAMEAVTDEDLTHSRDQSSTPPTLVHEAPRAHVGPKLSLTVKKLSRPIRTVEHAIRVHLLSLGFWLRPETVTALFGILLLGAVMTLVYLKRPAPVLTVTDVLQRSIFAEEAIAANRNQVLHRTINLEERAASGEIAARRRIEVWQSAANGISASRLFDEKGSLIAGDWRRADGVQTLYSHASRPQIRPLPQAGAEAAIGFDNAWQFLPLAKEFSSLIGNNGTARLEENSNSYVVTYEIEPAEVSVGSRSIYKGQEAIYKGQAVLIRARLVLSRADLHAIEQTLVIQQGDEIREFHFVETAFELRLPATVAPAVFEPELVILPPTTPRPADTGKSSVSSVSSVSAAPIVATPELEVEVLRLLNQAGADMGEQIDVTRTSEGRLQIQGLTQTEKRKRELLSALTSLASNPAVRIDIETLNEALAKQGKSKVLRQPVTIETTQPSSNTIALDKELRQYFAVRNMSEGQTEEAIREFSDRALRRSLQVLKHAAALKTLAQRFSSQELDALDRQTRSKWLQLIKQHAEKLRQESAAWRREIAPLFPAVADQSGDVTPDIEGDSGLALATQRLFLICSENDRAIRQAFSISPESSSEQAIRSARFWRSLQGSEVLAAKISSAQ
jgi:RNA polymerase sigma factor (sigma-70 family)